MTANRFETRPIRRSDQDEWRPLWDGYNAFYGRSGPTSLPEEITRATWERFFDPADPVNAIVAVEQDSVVGLAHYLYHRSTTRLPTSAISKTCSQPRSCAASGLAVV